MADSRSSKQWLVIAVPAVTITAGACLLYTYRSNLLGIVTRYVAKSNPFKMGKQYLIGNYGPVFTEVYRDDLPVQGHLPKELQGAFVRTGPNPQFEPVHGYHWFDGDGMVHTVHIRDGKASYCNRFVETERLRHERAAGRATFLKLGDMVGKNGLLVLLLESLRRKWCPHLYENGAGTANTALTYHANRLLSLHEGDLPYALRVLCNGVVETVKRLGHLRGDGWKGPFTAHPKLDGDTGELFFFGYSFEKPVFLRVGVLDPAGQLSRKWDVDVPYPSMMHDMAITKHYIVLLHVPLVFDPEAMVKRGGMPLEMRRDLPLRVGLLRKDCPPGVAEVQWFELPSQMIFHVANAWEEEDGTVQIFACNYDDIDMSLVKDQYEESELPVFTRMTLDPSKGTASAAPLSTTARGDFPVVYPARQGVKTKYCWLGSKDMTSKTASFTGIDKVDLSVAPGKKDALVATIKYPQGCYGGEAFFVPRTADPVGAAPGTQRELKGDDDGFLLTYVYSSALDSSELHVYDAQTMSSTPLATVKLPQRVPYGFHGTWVTAEQLAAQATA